ncbi:conserved hypothetical protein [Rhodopseudomonas palustris BisB18]|uniref:Uncharacterized protein n=2 Tax=Rhodopseudomonas palustris TaxID=1076 RepID=Q20XI6_RHOPB
MATSVKSSSAWISAFQAGPSPTPTTANGFDRSRASRLAHVLERSGLAMMGAAGGLFVAAHLGRASVEILTFPVVILAMMIYAIVGFYLGIDLPPEAAQSADSRATSRVKWIERLSATGTFFAALAVFVSVWNIILDGHPHPLWTLLVGGGFVAGVTMQIAAGSIARARA